MKITSGAIAGIRQRSGQPGYYGPRIKASIFIIFLLVLLANKVLWFLPFVLIVPVIITTILTAPLFFLGALAVLLELFSTSMPGTMAVVVLLPWLMMNVTKRFYKEIKIDFSVSFYVLVALIIFSQLILITLSQVMPLWLSSLEPQIHLWQIVFAVPWLKAVFMAIASALVAATVSIFIRFNTSW